MYNYLIIWYHWWQTILNLKFKHEIRHLKIRSSDDSFKIPFFITAKSYSYKMQHYERHCILSWGCKPQSAGEISEKRKTIQAKLFFFWERQLKWTREGMLTAIPGDDVRDKKSRSCVTWHAFLFHFMTLEKIIILNRYL